MGLLVFIILGAGAAANLACGREADPAIGTVLVRKYRTGESTRYRTETRTTATVRTTPAGLEALLPPLPTQVSTRQQNTITVRAVHANGVADVEDRLNQLNLQYDLPPHTPKEIRDSSLKQQQALCQRAIGRKVVAHYDRTGHLLSVEDDHAIWGSLSAPLRYPFEQFMKLLLQQMGGSPYYPSYPVELNQEWKRSFRVNTTESSSWALEGETTYRYVGQTQYENSKVAMIDFSFTDFLAPVTTAPRSGAPRGPQTQADTAGRGLRLEVRGQGQGRMLVALEGGAILENQANIRQMLEISAASVPGVSRPNSDPITVQLHTETTFRMQSISEDHIEPSHNQAAGGAR